MTKTVEKQIKALRRKRDAIQAAIANLSKVIEDPETASPDYVQVTLESMQKSFDHFESIQDELEELDEEHEVELRQVIMNNYNLAVAQARQYLRGKTPLSSQSSNGSVISENGQHVQIPDSSYVQPLTGRLPEIGVPIFNGDVEEWASFWDLFSSLVDKKPLSNTAKLQYLRFYLRGKAAVLIQELTTIDSNYQVALDLLKKKFDCPKRALKRHWAILREYPKLTRDTPVALGNLVDTFRQHLRALENLGSPVHHWNLPLNDLISTKIGSATIWHWELSSTDNKMPAYTELLDFLEKRSTLGDLAPSYDAKPQFSKQNNSLQNGKGKQTKSNSHNVQTFTTNSPNKPFIKQCSFCSKNNHLIYYCDKFKALNAEARKKTVIEKSLCINCLRSNHTQETCRSPTTCSTCKQRHHSLLHLDNHKNTSESNGKSGNNAIGYVVNSPTGDLITTAAIYVRNNRGKQISCRAMLDTCSNTHFMTEGLAKRLGLKMTKCTTSVGVLNSMTTQSKGIVTASIHSKYNNYHRELSFCAVNAISGCVPSRPVQRRAIRIPKNINLADPEFHQPAEVEILIASGTALSLFCHGQITLSKPNEPELYLQKTLLGWVIGGSVPTNHSHLIQNFHVNTMPDFDLQNFWSMEEVPTTKFFTKEESLCEEHFRKNVVRNPDGKYTVALPFKENISQIGESKSIARKRLLSIERKLTSNPALKEKYTDVFSEYERLGHMTKINENEDDELGYYLPHHAVFKKGSLTTAVRIVFDGSAKTSSGISLNDTLLVGPTIQSDLFTLLLRFRKHRIVITGDIEKMYRQFLVRPEDRKYQRILWRNSDGQEQTYELNTVTFGLACAPFLAIRSLHQLAEDEKESFPVAAIVLKDQMYVDDALAGMETVSEAINLRDELTGLLRKGGLKIRQWASNSPELLKDIPPENVNQHLVLGDSDTIKTLGVRWNSNADTITYFVELPPLENTVTKRIILSQLSKIFDPLGLLSCVIITGKIMVQTLWKLKLDWNESLPLSLHEAWAKYYNQLHLLNNLSFERKIVIDDPEKIDLHAFCDSSELAFGSCIYVRSENAEKQIQVSLLCAKSRVAPVKSVSIPKLELCGAKLAANLMMTVKENMNIQFNSITLWTDSSIVLCWLRMQPATLQVFVANRVAEIQLKTDIDSWRHISSSDNPADLITRGLSPKNLIGSSLWRQGPDWLSRPEEEWPQSKFSVDPEDVPETRKVQCFATTSAEFELLKKYSCIFKLQKIIAHIMRWKNKHIRGSLISVTELESALKIIIRLVQQPAFSEEIHFLKSGKPLKQSSRLLTLNPFVDGEGLLRVGGRLKNSELPFSQRHPLLLPKGHHVTRLLIEAEHRAHAHAGVQATLYALRRRFWVTDGRSEVRKILRQCVPCCKLQPPSPEYLMGNLPAGRVTQARPFSRVGVDYCGHFSIKEKKRQNRNSVKAYVAIFVCFVTKAVHLEVVTDLSTDTFIGAFRRFIARRGLCTDIFSDNGSCFKGANNELKDLYALLNDPKHQAAVNTFAASHNIQWHFTPARSPSFGGLWESKVKSFKHHLYRVVGKNLFTYEEFATFTCEIEAILNSRPLTTLSSDPNDILVLTPGHFLIGDSLTSLPNLDLRETPVGRLSSWEHIQQVKQHFWSRWSREYLNELTVRHKWTKHVPSVSEGTVVLLKQNNLPPMQWNMGVIVKCHPGTDGVTRVVTVKTSRGTVDRSVRNIAPLPINCDDHSPQI